MDAAGHFAKAEKHAADVDAFVDRHSKAAEEGELVPVHIAEHNRAIAALTVQRGQLHAALADIALRLEGAGT